jgi:hypothetical protein
VIRSIVVVLASLGATVAIAAPATAEAAHGNNGWQASPSCYIASSGDCVESPDGSTSNVTAICRDGDDSHSEHRSGTCSGHGGVAQWCPCGSTAQSEPITPPLGAPAQNVSASSEDVFASGQT